MVCYPCVRCKKTKPVAQLTRRIDDTGKLVFVCKGSPCADDGRTYTLPTIDLPSPPGARMAWAKP